MPGTSKPCGWPECLMAATRRPRARELAQERARGPWSSRRRSARRRPRAARGAAAHRGAFHSPRSQVSTRSPSGTSPVALPDAQERLGQRRPPDLRGVPPDRPHPAVGIDGGPEEAGPPRAPLAALGERQPGPRPARRAPPRPAGGARAGRRPRRPPGRPTGSPGGRAPACRRGARRGTACRASWARRARGSPAPRAESAPATRSLSPTETPPMVTSASAQAIAPASASRSAARLVPHRRPPDLEPALREKSRQRRAVRVGGPLPHHLVAGREQRDAHAAVHRHLGASHRLEQRHLARPDPGARPAAPPRRRATSSPARRTFSPGADLVADEDPVAARLGGLLPHHRVGARRQRRAR